MDLALDAIFSRSCVSCGTSLSDRDVFLHLTAAGGQLTEISSNDTCWEEVSKLLEKTPPSNRPNGFLIHRYCWALLSNQFKSGELNLEKLLETLSEKPPRCLDDDIDHLVFELKPPSFQQCARGAGFRAAARALPATNGSYILRDFINTHYFECIPLEIRLEIATFLSTVDFLNLRLCSRAMADIFEDQTFWKTRFFIHGDRGYLGFLTECIEGAKAKDWRLIYRCTHNLFKLHRDLRSRRQQWRHNRSLRDVYTMTREQNPLLHARVDTESLRWQKAGRKIPCLRYGYPNEPSYELCSRCLTTHQPLTTQLVPFSRAIVGLAISVLSDPRSDGDTFVAGLELIYPSDMPNTILGYRAPGNQTMIDFEGRPLRGFAVIIGIGAFRAIRPLFNPMNNWFGRPANNSEELECEFEYMQISTDDEILALSADFDHCKLIGLEIGTAKPHS